MCQKLKMKSNVLSMRVGKLCHLMPSVSEEVTGSEQCSAAGGVLGQSRGMEENWPRPKKENDCGQFGATEVKCWG